MIWLLRKLRAVLARPRITDADLRALLTEGQSVEGLIEAIGDELHILRTNREALPCQGADTPLGYFLSREMRRLERRRARLRKLPTH